MEESAQGADPSSAISDLARYVDQICVLPSDVSDIPLFADKISADNKTLLTESARFLAQNEYAKAFNVLLNNNLPGFETDYLSGKISFYAGCYFEASILFRRAITRFDEYGELWFLYGISMYQLGRFASATVAFGKASKINSKHHDAKLLYDLCPKSEMEERGDLKQIAKEVGNRAERAMENGMNDIASACIKEVKRLVPSADINIDPGELHPFFSTPVNIFRGDKNSRRIALMCDEKLRIEFCSALVSAGYAVTDVYDRITDSGLLEEYMYENRIEILFSDNFDRAIFEASGKNGFEYLVWEYDSPYGADKENGKFVSFFEQLVPVAQSMEVTDENKNRLFALLRLIGRYADGDDNPGLTKKIIEAGRFFTLPEKQVLDAIDGARENVKFRNIIKSCHADDLPIDIMMVGENLPQRFFDSVHTELLPLLYDPHKVAKDIDTTFAPVCFDDEKSFATLLESIRNDPELLSQIKAEITSAIKERHTLQARIKEALL